MSPRAERLRETLHVNCGPCNVVLLRFGMLFLRIVRSARNHHGFSQIEFFDNRGTHHTPPTEAHIRVKQSRKRKREATNTVIISFRRKTRVVGKWSASAPFSPPLSDKPLHVHQRVILAIREVLWANDTRSNAAV